MDKYQSAQLKISGMHCQACATRIEKVLKHKEAVKAAQVNYASEDAQIAYDPKNISLQELIDAITQAGYSVQEATGDLTEYTYKKESFPWRLLTIWLIACLFIIHMGAMVLKTAIPFPLELQFILSSTVQWGLAYPLYKSVFSALRDRTSNMDTLLVLATSAIWLLSTILWLYQGDKVSTYFETNVMVIAFVSLGKYLEARTKHQSLNSLNALVSLFPTEATVWKNHQWVKIPYDLIAKGDKVRATLGEKIAADGLVKEGWALANESHLTGESLPVEKKIGSTVLAGSTVTEGAIHYEVTHQGKESVLGDMVKALHSAQASKAPIARLADKVSAWFIPAIFLAALLTLIMTYLITGNFINAVIRAGSLLVVACPCALGLAPPAAIMAGMGAASRQGIWFKNAMIMEATGRVEAVVFDKTGTFTAGEPSVVANYQVKDSGLNSDQLLALAASVENYSHHPFARALVLESQKKQLPLKTVYDIQEQAGCGIRARVEGIGTVKVGKLSFVNASLPETLPSLWNISSHIGVAINDKFVGAFALSDPILPDSITAVALLKKRGINVYLLSGDHPPIVKEVARTLHIPLDHAQGNCTPRDKARYIEALQAQKQKIAMVGDGVNDAPALATATVGIAMGNGTDIAKQTAGITLLHHSVKDIVNALYISEKTLKNIKENLFFAFIYNIIGIPLAATGWLSPIIAGIAMSLSSISVLFNALRLRRIKLL